MRKIILFALVLITIFSFVSCDQNIEAKNGYDSTEPKPVGPYTLSCTSYVSRMEDDNSQLIYLYKDYNTGARELYAICAIIGTDPFNVINVTQVSDRVWEGTTDKGVGVRITVTGSEADTQVKVKWSTGEASVGNLQIMPSRTAGTAKADNYNTFINNEGDEIRVYYMGDGPQIFFMHILRLEVKAHDGEWVVLDRPDVSNDESYNTYYETANARVTFLTPGDVMDIEYTVNGSAARKLNDLELMGQKKLAYNDVIPEPPKSGEEGYYTIEYDKLENLNNKFVATYKKYVDSKELYNFKLIVGDVTYYVMNPQKISDGVYRGYETVTGQNERFIYISTVSSKTTVTIKDSTMTELVKVENLSDLK